MIEITINRDDTDRAHVRQLQMLFDVFGYVFTISINFGWYDV